VRAGDVAVQNDCVVVVHRDGGERFVAIEREVGGDGFEAKAGLQCLGQELLIFDDQYPHVRSLPAVWCPLS
jgi:hypothetical protein